MKPVSEIGITLSEGVGLVKPRGLSRMVVIGFPFGQVESWGKLTRKPLSSGIW
jgi:hypothetical protein